MEYFFVSNFKPNADTDRYFKSFKPVTKRCYPTKNTTLIVFCSNSNPQKVHFYSFRQEILISPGISHKKTSFLTFPISIFWLAFKPTQLNIFSSLKLWIWYDRLIQEKAWYDMVVIDTKRLSSVHFWFKYDLGQKYYAPQVQPTRFRTHDLQIMTIQFISLRRPGICIIASFLSLTVSHLKLYDVYLWVFTCFGYQSDNTYNLGCVLFICCIQ